jgi:hypothetical protein
MDREQRFAALVADKSESILMPPGEGLVLCHNMVEGLTW